MNDFTKEELHTILFWGRDRAFARGEAEFIREGSDLIWNKIQVMIDNYCNHEISAEMNENKP